MKKEDIFIIGVDGGGTKTTAVLAGLDGHAVRSSSAGASNPRNVGIGEAAGNIGDSIARLLAGKRNCRVFSTFIGLPAVEEEFKSKKSELASELKKIRKIAPIFKGKVEIGSDQLVAFRAGTDRKNGLVAIAGTGCVAHGWKDGREAKASGWGWLADEGSAFWIGQKAFQAILKSADGRSFKTIMGEIALKNLKLRDMNGLIKFVYGNPAKNLPMLSILCDEACNKGDDMAKEILAQAGKEIALSVRDAASWLGFGIDAVPLVLVGGVFRSETVLETVEAEVKKIFPNIEVVLVENPAFGAVRLAMEKATYGKNR